MTLQNSRAEDCELFSRIKELSGKLIERRRRRDHVSQRHLAEAVGRSERWVREIEAGASTSMLEDHIRCAHSLQMATPHLFIPLLAMEHNVDLSRDLLLQDDLWDLEEDILAVIMKFQEAILSRLARRSGTAGHTKP
jgi:transcriptional regulator with XRE-family HTH domain